MTDWTQIFSIIPTGTNEGDFEDRFMLPFLEGIGFQLTEYTKDKSFSKSGITIKPDFYCKATSSFAKESSLVIEAKAVKRTLIDDAVSEVQQQMLISKAKFGLAINGLQCQLWQRHGNICVPRTRLTELNANNVESIISKIKEHLQSPRRALTSMFWNNKGGVGKTTTTANIATTLAMYHDVKVLLINFDFQGDLNVIMGFTRMEEYQPETTILDVLADANVGLGKHSLKSLIRSRKYEAKARLLQPARTISLDIIPGDKSMKLFEKGKGPDELPGRQKSSSAGAKIESGALMSALDQAGIYADYDYIFIDSSPNWEPTGRIASNAVDVVFPIIDNSTFAVDAVIRLQEQLLIEENFPDSYVTVPAIGRTILNCRFQSRENTDNEVQDIAERLSAAKLSESISVMRNNVYIAKAVKKGIPVVVSRSNSPETKNLKKIAEEIFISK